MTNISPCFVRSTVVNGVGLCLEVSLSCLWITTPLGLYSFLSSSTHIMYSAEAVIWSYTLPLLHLRSTLIVFVPSFLHGVVVSFEREVSHDFLIPSIGWLDIPEPFFCKLLDLVKAVNNEAECWKLAWSITKERGRETRSANETRRGGR